MDDEPGNEPRLREPRVTGRSTARVITLHGRGEYATFIGHERPIREHSGYFVLAIDGRPDGAHISLDEAWERHDREPTPAQPEPAREPAAGGDEDKPLIHRGFAGDYCNVCLEDRDTPHTWKECATVLVGELRETRRQLENTEKELEHLRAQCTAEAEAEEWREHAEALTAARAELERERMRLAAIGTVGWAQNVEHIAGMLPEYDSDALQSVRKLIGDLDAATAEGERMRAMVTQQRDAAVALLSAAAASGRGESTDVPARLELQLRMVAEAASAALSLLAPAPGVSERAAGKEG